MARRTITSSGFSASLRETPGRDRLIECNPDLVGKATNAFDAAFADAKDGPNLMLGTVASGDRFVQDTDMLRWLQREFAALATEMEGAAFGYTCAQNSLPFVVIRALSDASSESASGDFEANLHKACQNSFHLMDQLIPQAMIDVAKVDRRKR